MKKTITTVFIGSLILWGCSSKNEQPVEETENQTTEITETDCGEVHDHQVYTITAHAWVESWKSVLHDVFEPQQINAHSSDYLYKRSFDPEQVLEYVNQCTDCEDVRLYFVDLNPSQLWLVDDLLMVNVSGCEDQIGDSVLVSDSAQAFMIDLLKAQEALALRSELSAIEEYSFLRNVIAYTYDKQTIIEQAQKDMASGKKMEFEFAMHTVLPSSGGSSSEEEEGQLMLDLLLVSVDQNDVHSFSDFARPCPELCGVSSPLYSTNP